MTLGIFLEKEVVFFFIKVRIFMKFIIFYGKRLVLTNYIHIYFHRALYLIVQCSFG